jgi:NADH:ubiquinone oxidoreductase subunit 3 (subunit A)
VGGALRRPSRLVPLSEMMVFLGILMLGFVYV